MINRIALAFVALAIPSAAILPAQSTGPHAWRTVAAQEPLSEPAAPYSAAPYDVAQNDPAMPYPYNDPPPPPSNQQMQRDQSLQSGQPMQSGPPMQYGAVPARLIIRQGTWTTVHVNQVISSNKSQAGDTFFASLAEPIIVDGVVVAHRGQTVMGTVSVADNPSRGEGRSRLDLQLTTLTLADGSQVPLQSQVIDRRGNSTTGRDVGAVATTTALGAAIGGAAGYGKGAAIGATAGAAAGIIGLMVSKGEPTVVYPETLLTFQIDAPVTISTDRAPGAFRYADSQDYGVARLESQPRDDRQGPPSRVYARPYPYPYFGSGFSLYVGPRFGYYGGGYRGGFRGRGRW